MYTPPGQPPRYADLAFTKNPISGETVAIYPVRDRVTWEECKKLGIDKAIPYAPTCDVYPANVKAVWTGEVRPPKAGEWFLSGSVVEAYKASTDAATMSYHIARLVKVTKIEINVIEG